MKKHRSNWHTPEVLLMLMASATACTATLGSPPAGEDDKRGVMVNRAE